MTTLQAVLQKDHSKKTKAELVDFLSALEKTLTPAVYEKVSGISPSELQNLTKSEILNVIESFVKKYDANWESSLADVSSKTMTAILGQIAADEKSFAASNVTDGGFAAELGSIDFAKIIGGPLDACVNAQANASVSTVSFINEVGFEGAGANKKLRMADFKYKKTVPDPADPTKTKQEDVEISVPFIALLNIPSFRIETCEIDFNVKLNSTYTKDTSSEFGINSSTSGGTSGLSNLFAKAKFSVDVSYKRTTSTGVKIEKEYSLGIRVKATNDEIPAGLEKVLGLLSV